MSLQQIIEDLQEMGEDEVASKLIFARLKLLEGYGPLSETASSNINMVVWYATPEGRYYWSDLHDRLEQYRESRP